MFTFTFIPPVIDAPGNKRRPSFAFDTDILADDFNVVLLYYATVSNPRKPEALNRLRYTVKFQTRQVCDSYDLKCRN